MNARTYMTATNPGTNPLYFNSDVEIRTSGIGIIDYSNVTVTDVEVWNNNFGYHSGPYMSGGYYGGGGGWYTNSRQQVTALVTGDFTSSPSPMFTLRDIEISDGSDWFHLYYNPTYSGTGVPTYANNLLIENVTVTYARNRVFWFELRTSDKDPRDFDINTRVTDSHFEGLSSQVLYYYFWPGEGMDPSTPTVNIDEMFRFDNNTITQSTYSWTYVDIGSGANNMPNDKWDKMVLIADNDFVNTQGVFFYTWAHWSFKRGNDMFYMVNNNLENVSIQWDGPFYVYEYDTVRVLGNTFKDMAAGRTADLYDAGGSNAGLTPTDWLFKGNTWDNCTNSQWAEVLFLEFGGDVVFDGNEVMNQNGLISLMPWMEYTGASSMNIVNNKFHDNTAYFVEYGNPDPDFPNFVMTIRSNEVYNNEDFFLNYWGSTSTLTNFDYDATFIIEDNDFHDNAGGCIHAWGDVSVENNTFTNNAGPLLFIDYINLNVPYVADNMMVNNVDLFMFQAKDRGYQLVAMNLTDQALTCTGTALHLTNMEVTLERVDIDGAETAILAWNTFVNAYGCTIDGDSCRVVADGLITTWWPIEVYVTWGDKEGVDSSTPVSEALVVFNTASGDYYSSAYANTGGMLAEELYQQWSVDLGGVYWYSPYTMKVAASGATNDTEVVLDRDLIGNDMVHLILWDAFPPVVAITEPFDGAIFAKSSVETFGFVAEVGSGLEMVEYSTDGGDNWNMMNIAGTGDWTLTLSDLADGEVSLMVQAKDVAGNIAESKVTITIDTTPPALSINALPTITNVPEVSITGTVEVGAEVFLNGMTLGISVDPTLSIDHTLHEGVNVIVVEAMDMAGNMAMQTLTVELDTIEPVLVVTGPANGI
ncbi:MAG: hypothetical protein GWN18_06810, partial [Thermoplasmata archaeon]|nr:hypothetical protein [Thermoplasmata archaeon]NIS11790.1 hypothetical protein [Thermoplasmata archaeon]NIS19675.1 hypothetical protein [Thermoplasmata archaeon]NIT76854.1 hypothetical protein [Thermoplasmata archaeon]NIU48786.1 hypothetical protein [Thermoplasmata archaeon]